jgi:hypothetical protein
LQALNRRLSFAAARAEANFHTGTCFINESFQLKFVINHAFRNYRFLYSTHENRGKAKNREIGVDAILIKTLQRDVKLGEREEVAQKINNLILSGIRISQRLGFSG